MPTFNDAISFVESEISRHQRMSESPDLKADQQRNLRLILSNEKHLLAKLKAMRDDEAYHAKLASEPVEHRYLIKGVGCQDFTVMAENDSMARITAEDARPSAMITNVLPLPYTWCYDPERCAGRSYCAKKPACSE